MNARTKLLLAVGVLFGVGGGLAAYKHGTLDVPFWVGEREVEWLIEAKLSFAATGKEVRASLALPRSSLVEGANQEAGSVGYGYHMEDPEGNPSAVWTARKPEGNQSLYYRLRLSEQERTGAERVEVEANVPMADPPGLSKSLMEAARGVVQRAVETSADKDSLFIELFQQLGERQNAQEIVVLRRHYEQEGGSAGFVMLGIDLLRLAGVAARPAFGLRLEEMRGGQPPVRLVEYFDGVYWKVRDPMAPAEPLRQGKWFVWHRGPGPLLEVFGGENSRVEFTVLRDRMPLERMTDLRNQPFLISTIHGLPASERAVFRYVVLIPLGAFIVVLMRNLVGVPTLGTFMPVLLALALIEMRLTSGLVMFALIIASGLVFRSMLSRLNLLVVPRVAACVVIVTLLMMLLSVVSWKLELSSGLQITLFPMIILSWTIERMSLIWEEEGPRNALIQVSGSLVVAVASYAFMSIRQIQYWAFYFPELLLVLLGGILLLGRYTGYRLSELFRFRNFSEAR